MTEKRPDYDAIIIGAGFAGMYMLTTLRQRCFSAHVIETAQDVGGTWYWNRYPGARCDVESLYYCYSFSERLQQEWEWTERFPSQPEILHYARHVADRFDLRRDITFGTTVRSADYDDGNRCWWVCTTAGASITARYLISAVGCLSSPRTPDFPGIESFSGESYHTGNWPHRDVEFTGKRVGVIGTGSSGIQAIPKIAEHARHLTVFQRTAQFSIPARNRPLDPAEQAAVKADYARLREEARHTQTGILHAQAPGNAAELPRQQVDSELHQRWAQGGMTFSGAFPDTLIDPAANEISAEFVRDRIRETVHDPDTAELLCPTDHPIGTKRICVDTDYYTTYNRDNVDLVSVREQPITRVVERGLQIGDREFELDALVFATGYDALTGPLNDIDIRGPEGGLLRDKWAAGPRSYLGLASSGFPNMFTITGPGSPSVLSNMIVSIEQHVEWITEHLHHLRNRGLTRTEADPDAEDEWVAHVNEAAGKTLYPQAASWYMGANIPGKARVFIPYIGGVGMYREICQEVADAGYRGFHLTA